MNVFRLLLLLMMLSDAESMPLSRSGGSGRHLDAKRDGKMTPHRFHLLQRRHPGQILLNFILNHLKQHSFSRQVAKKWQNLNDPAQVSHKDVVQFRNWVPPQNGTQFQIMPINTSANPNINQFPYGNPGQLPYGNPGQLPYGNPGQLPYGNPGQLPYSNPGQLPYGNPGQLPYSNPGQLPYGNPGQLPYGYPEQLPYGNLGQLPYGYPGQLPNGNPGQLSYSNPGQLSYGNSGQPPYGNPGQLPYGNPAQIPLPVHPSSQNTFSQESQVDEALKQLPTFTQTRLEKTVKVLTETMKFPNLPPYDLAQSPPQNSGYQLILNNPADYGPDFRMDRGR